MRIERIIAELLLLIAHKQEKTLSQLDDLTAALATTTADTQKFIGDVATQVKSLQDQIADLQAANPGVDLTAALASVNALDALVKGADPVLA